MMTPELLLNKKQHALLATSGFIAIAITILVIVYVALWISRIYIRRYVAIAVFADITSSMEENKFFMNCVNVNKHDAYWNINENKLSLYAMGTKLPARFYKVPEIPNGYRIEFTEELNNKQVIALTGALKYNQFVLSNDDGETTVKINSIKDRDVKRVVTGLNKTITKHEDYEIEDVIKKMKGSMKYSYIKNEVIHDGVIANIDEDKATTNSLRYQAAIPEGNKVFDLGFNEKTIKFYHSYNGKLYELESVFLNKVKSLYEWEFINLEPGTIYAGISVSFDGGKFIFPSSTLYGITREEDGGYPDVTNALLGKPKNEKESHPMWKPTDATTLKEKKIMKLTCDVLVKKHFEDEHPDEFLPLDKAEFAYQYYNWIPFKLEELKKEIAQLKDEQNEEIKATIAKLKNESKANAQIQKTK